MPPRAFASLRSPLERGIPPSEPPVRIPPESPRWAYELKQCMYGGEGGVRTHGTIAGTRDFQSRRFGRSRTSPRMGTDIPTNEPLMKPDLSWRVICNNPTLIVFSPAVCLVKGYNLTMGGWGRQATGRGC